MPVYDKCKQSFWVTLMSQDQLFSLMNQFFFGLLVCLNGAFCVTAAPAVLTALLSLE